MTELCYKCALQWQNYDKVLMKQTKNSNQYLQFCRSETDCQSRIHCLLEAVCLTFNSTRPPPAIVRPLQVKFESIIISNAQNSAFYTDCLSRNCLVFVIEQELPGFCYWAETALLLSRNCLVSFIGQKLPCFFYWTRTALFLLLGENCPISFIGQELPYALALSLPHPLFSGRNCPMLLVLGRNWPMLLVLTSHKLVLTYILLMH